MASKIFRTGLRRIVESGLNGMTLKVMLLSAEQGPYVFDATDEYVADLVAAETNASNYARSAAITDTIQVDTVNNRVEVVIPDTVFTSLGGGTNEDIEWAILFHDTGNDATAPLIAAFDLTGTTNMTNGTNFTLDFSAEGNLQFTYTP